MTKLTKVETRRVRAALMMAIAFESEFGDNIQRNLIARSRVSRRLQTKRFIKETARQRRELAKSRRTTEAFTRLLTRLSHER